MQAVDEVVADGATGDELLASDSCIPSVALSCTIPSLSTPCAPLNGAACACKTVSCALHPPSSKQSFLLHTDRILAGDPAVAMMDIERLTSLNDLEKLDALLGKIDAVRFALPAVLASLSPDTGSQQEQQQQQQQPSPGGIDVTDIKIQNYRTCVMRSNEAINDLRESAVANEGEGQTGSLRQQRMRPAQLASAPQKQK